MALIAQIAHDFSNHLDPVGLRNYIGLFIIVWWAWINGTMYHELHGNNDIRTRVFTFLQMFGVVAMSVFAHDAIGKNFDGFALFKGFVISAKERAFEIPFETIIDCFFQPMKGGRSFLTLLTTKGKITIPDTISDYQRLYENLKVLAAQTPDPNLVQKPWFQGVLFCIAIWGGLAVVFAVYLYFWG